MFCSCSPFEFFGSKPGGSLHSSLALLNRPGEKQPGCRISNDLKAADLWGGRDFCADEAESVE